MTLPQPPSFISPPPCPVTLLAAPRCCSTRVYCTEITSAGDLTTLIEGSLCVIQARTNELAQPSEMFGSTVWSAEILPRPDNRPGLHRTAVVIYSRHVNSHPRVTCNASPQQKIYCLIVVGGMSFLYKTAIMYAICDKSGRSTTMIT